MENTLYRHGDVELLKVKSPARKGRKKLPHLTLAEGEATGHAHRIVDGSTPMSTVMRTHPVTGEKYEVKFPIKGQEVPSDSVLYEQNGEWFLSVKKKAALVHEDHGAIVLPKGTYRKIQQREWTPEGNVDVLD